MRLLMFILIVFFTSCTNTWKVVSINGPEPRYVGEIIYADSNLLLFGGKNSSQYFNDLWKWDGKNWYLVGNGASKRWDHSYVFMDDYDQIFLFGGRTFEDNEGKKERIDLNDNWIYKNNVWQELKIKSPEIRSSHRLAYSPKAEIVILFGGRNKEQIFNDTWVFNGEEWNKLDLLPPKGRFGHTLTYDSQSGNFYLFGGHDGKNLLNDFWKFDGIQWIEIDNKNKPTPRMAHAMKFDNNGSAILYGGWDNSNSVSDELWLWKKNNWTLIKTKEKPQARLSHAIGFDQLNNEFVLFGGSTGFNGDFLSETWIFN